MQMWPRLGRRLMWSTNLWVSISCEVRDFIWEAKNRQIFDSQILVLFATFPLIQFSKFNNFLWVCWFLGKNLSNFITPVWKLQNMYCHTCHQLIWYCRSLNVEHWIGIKYLCNVSFDLLKKNSKQFSSNLL